LKRLKSMPRANEKIQGSRTRTIRKIRKLQQQSDSIEQYIHSLKQKLSEIGEITREEIDAD
jgi:hypothetical protein